MEIHAQADRRQKLERLCRNISRPAISEQRLSLTLNGNPVPAEDPVPRRHDARHLTPGILPSAGHASLRLFKIAPGDLVEPLDFIARLAALVPKPRVNLALTWDVIG